MAARYLTHFALLVMTFGTEDEAAACAPGPGRGGQEVLDANSFLQLVTEGEVPLHAAGAEEVAPVEEIAKAEIDLLKERGEQETEILKKIVEMKEHEARGAGRESTVRGHAAGEDGAGSGSAIEMEGRRSPRRRPVPPYLPQDILTYYDEKLAARMRSALAAGAVEGAQPAQRFEYERCHRSDSNPAAKNCLNSHKDSVFEAANVSFSLPTGYLGGMGAGGEANKNIVRMDKDATRGCVVYGFGIAGHSEFEEDLAKAGCEVHAFDCTVARDAASVRDKHFTFHKWCIGSLGDASFTGNKYTESSEGLEFRSLDNITKELGHTRIDVFKMDVEGFEYGIFESGLLGSSTLPLQLSFELHTEEASATFVPVENSKGKGYNQVSRLFLQLYDAGYRVISKEVNRWDPACAEYVLINVEQLQR